MLQISQSQMNVFKQIPLASFELQMVEHANKYFPNHCRVAGDEAVIARIHHATCQAQAYGFITQRDCCLYVTTMFMLGTHFDTDPMYNWVSTFLEPELEESDIDRAVELAETSQAFLQKCIGKENRDINRCFINLQSDASNIIRLFEDENIVYEQVIAEQLFAVFPTKAQLLGEHAINQLISDGLAMAATYGLTESPSKALLTIMMFLLGSSIDDDPFVPWVKSMLNDETIKSEHQRVQALQARCMGFIEQWMTKPAVT